VIQAFTLVIVVGFVAATAMSAACSFAKAQARHVAERYAEIGLIQARTSLRQAIARQVQGSGTNASYALPQSTSAPACGTAVPACPFRASTSFVSAAAKGSSIAENAPEVQTAIGEGRVAVTITVTITAGEQAVVAARSQTLTLRTFNAAPYAMVSGAADAGSGTVADVEGDTGSCDPSNMASCDAQASAPLAAATPFSDTRIHVVQVCQEDGNGGSCAGATPRPVDAFAPQSWQNTNGATTGWSR